MNKRFYLHDGWSFCGYEYKDVPAKVPGCVHTDLMRAGYIPDLFYRDENSKYTFLENEDWTYRLSFDADSLEESAKLVFEGLDTYTDIYLNGVHLGETHNMFIKHTFDVSGKLFACNNILEVKFRSPINEVEGCPKRQGAFTTERINTRRMQCTYYWDWVDRFITAGIWLPVYIEYGSEMKIDNAYVYTESVDSFGAQLNVTLNFENYELGDTVKILISDDEGKPVYEKEYFVREQSLNFRVNVKNPKLWYPHGYGEQPLYRLIASAGDNVFEQRFGIRILRVVEEQDEIGSPYYERAMTVQNSQEKAFGQRTDTTARPSGFSVIVNGVRIFARGANYVPCEPYPSEITDEKIRDIVKLAKDCGVNMIRVWGGGIFEKDSLYSACDEAGILVTQDFLMACGTYPEKEDWFINELKKEAEHAALRLRNHPSLAWWSGDNENATRGSDTLADHVGRDSAMRGIEPVVRALDPARRFFRSSPYGGDKYMSQTAGTTHTTNFFTPIFKYLMGEDNSGYKEFYNLLAARFIAEEPTYGLPETSSLLRFMTKEDVLDDTEKILRFHSKTNPHCPITLYDYVSGFAKNLLGDFVDAEDRLFKYRYIQYEWIRVIFENCRRYIGYCDGLVFWMLNDCWPASMGWSLIDYYNRPKASYYSFRRCAKSIIGSVVAEDGKYKLFVSSDGTAGGELKINVKALNLETKSEVSAYQTECSISGYTSKEIQLPFELSEKLLIVADIVTESGDVDRCFYKSGKLSLRRSDGIEIKTRDENSITVKAKEYVHAVSIEGDAVFSDNYFSLFEGEERTVYLDGKSNVSVKAYTLA